MWEFDQFVDFMAEPPAAGQSSLDRLWEHARSVHGSDVLDDDFSIVEVSFS
jgi:hypothetical protein